MSELLLPEWLSYAPRLGRVGRLLVGFSGGLDSTVLLYLARRWSLQSSVPIVAVHVNHQLSAHAFAWQQHCVDLCEAWGIALHCEAVHVDAHGVGVESAARAARYQVFQRLAKPSDVLLLGHHRDDQVETFFLRLMRGSGVLGLASMDDVSEWQGLCIVRPLLGLSKSVLHEFAKSQQWTWVEDESNQSDRYDRNFLRLEVLPRLAQRWPSSAEAVERSVRHCREAQGLLDELAAMDVETLCQTDGGISVDRLRLLSLSRARNVLRYWLRSFRLSLPSEARLNETLAVMLQSAEDAAPLVLLQDTGLRQSVELRRFDGAIYVVPRMVAAIQPFHLVELKSQMLPAGGRLLVSFYRAGMVPPNRSAVSVRKLAAHKLDIESAAWRIDYRKGGERVKLAGHPTRPLKKILQEHRVPPWWRDRLPLLYKEDVLVAVAGLGVVEGYQMQAGEDGVQIDWEAPELPKQD
ncbi:Predicted tRNA(Ile)-lysidine synthetase [gamma proteobacterium HdN1]|nr:Predicted tRNA(Ile)-lysidine synthetase [gamma proteobacterium HdN1]